jgi:drug/metabolite transporter (DMT)-like permease
MLLGEYFGWPQGIGLALVIAAIGVMQYKPRAVV